MACGALFLSLALSLLHLVLADKITVKEGIVANERTRDLEPEVNLFQPLSQLNGVTFGQNVLEPSNNGVDRWVVLFCLSWYEPCEALQRPFEVAGGEWQDVLNTDLLSTDVRFATVDCATDRVLCNEQMIHEYPQVVLYHKHSAVSAWSAGGVYTKMIRGMRKWLSQHLSALAVEAGETTDHDNDVSDVKDTTNVGLDILLVIVAMLGNAWVVTRNPDPNPAEKSPRAALAGQNAQALITSTVGRFLPEDWLGERTELEL